MTDSRDELMSCPLPAGALDDLGSRSRDERINDHWIGIKFAGWWDEQIATAGLPGGPLRVRHREDGTIGLSRGDIFKLAKPLVSDAAAPDDDVLAFLWNTLAWGSRGKWLVGKRIRAVAVDPQQAVRALRDAIGLASSDPDLAYATLYPRLQGVRGPRKTRHPVIPQLGPAFITKVLYFAGGGKVDHRCAILDRRVAKALRTHCSWTSLGDNYWSPEEYQRYVDLLGAWADKASSELGREVGRDEFERFLFGR